MSTALIILAVIFVAIIIYLSTLEGQYHIDRSLLINASVEDAYNAVVDLKSWPEWSPWLLHEPETPLIYSDNYQQEGGYYSWDGQLVGSGKLSHLKLTHGRTIQQKIEFIKPFKSICSVSWHFKQVGKKTEVHWLMQGKMPFFFRFMTKMTINMINKDYDLGLNLLNGYLNKQNPHPVISFCGTEELQSFRYCYRSFNGFLKDLVPAMETGFHELTLQTEKLSLPSGLPLTIYYKADFDKQYFECDIAIAVDKQTESDDLQFKNFTGGKYFKVECMGDYKFLQLARYKAECHLKMVKLKSDKSKPSFEVYENDPQPLESNNDIKTSLYFPIK